MVSKPKVYLETSFISYMVGKDTTNVKIASEQAWTRKWWAEIAPTECKGRCIPRRHRRSLRG